MAIAVLTIDINAKLASLEKDMGRAAHVAEQNAKRMESAFKGASRALGAIGAALSVGAFAQMVKGVADAGDELAKMSTRTGVAVEELSKLQYAASLSDVSNEDLANSLGRLNRVLGEAADGSKEATAALARFGISPGTMNASEAFAQIADKVKNTSDQTKIASAMNDVFGKSWQTLVPLIKGGSEGLKQAGDELERMGGVMSEDLARSSEAFNDNITRLNTQLEALRIQTIGPLIPLLQEMTGEFAASSDKANDLAKSGSALKTAFEAVSVLGANVSYVLKQTGNEIGGLAAQLALLASGDFKGAMSIGGMMKDDAKQARAEFDALEYRLMNSQALNDARKIRDSWMPQASSASSLAGGITATPETPGKKKKDPKADLSQYEAAIDAEKAYFRAMEDIAKAQESARRSTLGLTAAQEKLLDLKQSPVWATLSEDQQRLAESQAKYADETIKASEAQARLNSLIDGLPSSQIERAWQDMELLAAALEAGKVSQTQYSEAVNKLFDGGADKIKKQKTLAEELGMTFSSAFEDAIVKGKEFSDVLEGIAQDILRIMVRKNITNPLTNALGSFDFSGRFGGYHEGGIVGSEPSFIRSVSNLPKYHSGGIVGDEMPILAKRGEGVFTAGQMAAMGGGNVQVIVNNNASNTQATQTTRDDGNGGSIIEVVIEQITGRISSDIARGSGAVPAAMERTYGLNRSAGAY